MEVNKRKFVLHIAETSEAFSIDGFLNGSESDADVRQYLKIVRQLVTENVIQRADYQPFPEDGELSVVYEKVK